MKIAIYGGAFNPVHLGHIQIVKTIQYEFDFDKILVIPSKISPHKSSVELISAKHRLNMCKLAFHDIENCEVSDIEINNDGISYTVKTFEMLKNIYIGAEFYLICGSDMFLSLLKWKEYEKIFNYAKTIAFIRDNEDINMICDYKRKIEKYGAKVEIFRTEILPFSSTKIRNSIKNNIDFKNYVCKDVYDYITRFGLYK